MTRNLCMIHGQSTYLHFTSIDLVGQLLIRNLITGITNTVVALPLYLCWHILLEHLVL